jgi:type IV pilus assembly protein PilM
MIRLPFSGVIKKTIVGIDIGVSFIKVVELSRRRGKIELNNYGHIAASSVYQKPFQSFEEGSFLVSSPDVSKIIKSILKETGIKTKESVFTIPDFSTFSTSFDIPQMTEDEMQSAIEFEARRHIPIPVSEVSLDYFVTDGEPGKTGPGMKILLIAVPNEIIEQYRNIAESSGLDLKFLEAEAFSLTRALAKDYKDPICLLDIGAQSTTINIADRSKLKVSFSSDIAGNNFTRAISKAMSTSFRKAEFLKEKHGLNSEEIKESLLPLINLIIIEVEKILKDCYKTEKKEVKKSILSGGSSNLPGLKEHLASHFNKEIEIANPFFNFSYPKVLEEEIKKIGPSYSVAVGAALRNLK